VIASHIRTAGHDKGINIPRGFHEILAVKEEEKKTIISLKFLHREEAAQTDFYVPGVVPPVVLPSIRLTFSFSSIKTRALHVQCITKWFF
jgi:hypothetical protein